MEVSAALTRLIIVAIAAGVSAQVLANLIKVPSIVFLLLFGVALGGNGLGWVRPQELDAGLGVIVSLSVALILFEGGLNLELQALAQVSASVRNLVTTGTVITLVGGGMAAHWLGEFPWAIAFLYSSLVVVTGPTVINSLLKNIGVERRLATVLEGEGVLIDAIGAVLAVVMLGIVQNGNATALEVVQGLVLRLGNGAIVGVGGGWLLIQFLRRSQFLADDLKSSVVVAAVLGLSELSQSLQSESGLMTAVIVGIMVRSANLPDQRLLLRFKSQLTVLMVSVVFILLSASLSIPSVVALGWGGVATVLVLMLVVRPLNVLVCTWNSNFNWRQKLFLSWCAPRGIVAASVASLFAIVLRDRGINGGEAIKALVFLTIAMTVFLQGLTAHWAAQLLGLTDNHVILNISHSKFWAGRTMVATSIPAFCEGIQYLAENFAATMPSYAAHSQTAAIAPGQTAISDANDPNAIFQTLLYADALRYLTLQVTGSKASGHPGGFASQAEAYAALVMLGHKNILTEVGHHAPGFYSAMFLDRSLEDMGITTVQQLRDRFRETHGLLGHLSGFIPGILAPAGPLGQGQHFAMAAARLHPGTLFPFTIGDGGLGEPYPMSSMAHFHTAFPQTTNFLPILVWNGYSQEHHSMVSLKTNAEMIAYWKGNGFTEVVMINAKDFSDRPDQADEYVDSTSFSESQRLAFTQAVLVGVDKAAKLALSGTLTVFIIKQLKGAGVHALGAKSHNLYPKDTLDAPHIIAALKTRALPSEAWQLVRTNCERAGGAPAAKIAVTESELALAELGDLPLEEFAMGENKVATTAMGKLVGAVGQGDRSFLVTNADGNEASGIANINQALKIIHPTVDPLYNQAPTGQVYEPLSEDACAGLAVGLALMGARSLWCSYESFAINGLPIWQTVTQAMAELRRPTPSTICLFTAGALEQGRNGWTHQRPEIEAYFAAMMRNGNVFPLFPPDANSIQVCYEWALSTKNKGIPITASKSPLPIRTTFAQTRQALQDGAIVLEELAGDRTVVFAVIGDMTLVPVFEAAQKLQEQGIGSRIVSVVNPRRLYRPHDTAWETCSQPDDTFLEDAKFEQIFGGDAQTTVLIGVIGGAAAMLEPIMLRSHLRRDIFAWKRGETTATAPQLMAFNGLTANSLSDRAVALLKTE